LVLITTKLLRILHSTGISVLRYQAIVKWS